MAKKRTRKTEDSTRRSLGRSNPSAMVPVPPPRNELPETYGRLLEELKQRIASERIRAVLSANAAMVLLYWDIGRRILDRQEQEGWGAKIIDRLSADLRDEFPDMSGLSLMGQSPGKSAIVTYTHINELRQQYQRAVDRSLRPVCEAVVKRMGELGLVGELPEADLYRSTSQD